MGRTIGTALSVAGAVGDLARGSAVLAAVVCAALGQWDEVLRFVVVSGVLLVSRLARLPRPFDAAMGVTLLAATVAMPAGWYVTVGWVDWVVHCATTGSVAAILVMALIRVELLPGLQSRVLTRHRATIVLLVVALGFTVGVLWECYEWLVSQVFGVSMVVGYTDTIADLTMDGTGALLAGIAVAAWAGRGRTTRRILESHRAPAGARRGRRG